MRLGLRLTLRPNGNKPAGGRNEDQSAPDRGADQPAVEQADDHPSGAEAGAQAAPGQPETRVSGPAAEDDSPWSQGPPTVAWPGDEPAGAGHGDRPASAEAEAAPASAGADGEPASAQTESVPAVSLPGDVPAISHEEYVPAVSLEDAVAAASTSAAAMSGAGAAAPGDQTALLGRLAREWDRIGLGRRAGALWARGIVTPWQRTVGRLGISRLWQPGPGVREASDPGARALALVTAMPVILLVAWLVPGLVLLLVRAFLPAPMVLISVPLAVAMTILVARELPGRWPRPDATQAPDATDAPSTTAGPGGTAASGTTAGLGAAAYDMTVGSDATAAAPDATAAVPDVTGASGAAGAPGTKAAPRTKAAPDAGARARAAHRPGRAWAAWWGLAGTVGIAVAFTIWQLVENSPQFIVSRDPGAYAQLAFWIAAHGRLPISASAAAFGGTHPGLTFASFGFTSHGGNVVPGLTAGLPIVLAVGMWAHGISGAAVISPLIGGLAILSVGGLTARLAGPQWAPASALLLALTVPEIYTSRSAFSDPLAQALLFGGLALVVDSFSSRRRITLASLGGLALGLTVLAGTSFLLMVLPVIVVAGALLAGRKPQAVPLAAGWLAGVICGLATELGLDAPALSTTTPSLRTIGILAWGLAVLTALGAAVALFGRLRRPARKLLDARPLRWLPEAAAVLVLLAGIGLAIRPYVQQVRGPASAYVAALQRLEGLPVDPGRVYAESSLYWVIWYLGVPALLLGLIGLAMVTRMCVRALITWRDPVGAARSWVLPVAIIGWGLFAVLWQPGTVPDQPWASRQLVPVVLPGLIVLAVWVAAWLIGRAHARDAGRVAVALATGCFVVALGVPPTAITFGIALSRPANPATRLALSGLAFRTTGAGEVAAVTQLCGALPPHSSVLLLDKVAARSFAEVIRGTCDLPTGIVAGASPGSVSAIIGGIERAGRHPALLATKPLELAPYGASSREIVNLFTQQDEHLLTRPPTSTWPVHYALWMSEPGGTVVGS